MPDKRNTEDDIGKGMTVQEFFERLDSFRAHKGSVIIHPGMNYHFLEFDKDFFEEVKQELRLRVTRYANGIEEPDPVTKFAVIVLANAY